ncbi:MAG TPA: DUF2145 domain-containing protein [Caulobacteraceae bacterium]|nr:DUF2145 domain-containing protein [Caulobacteraceae bacterium]
MIRRLMIAPLAAAFILVLGFDPAVAQDSSARSNAQHFTDVQAAAFSKTIERDLAAKGARLAMVFRTGRTRDSLPDGIAYTHGAFWVHRTISTDSGPAAGYAVYNLYAGDGKAWPTIESRLVQDWPLDFVRGSKVDDVAVIIPSPEMQRRIIAVIDSQTYQRLHNPDYALVSNPFAPKYQNCTAFLLDVVAAAAWQTDEPRQILADLRAHFTPTTVKAGGLVRLFGPLADARLRNDDQKGPVRTATYESLVAFMRDNGLLQEAYVINYTP